MSNDRKIIVAFDFNDKHQAQLLLEKLDPNLCRIKIGKEMFCLYGPEWVRSIISQGFDVFLDLKFHDIPTTVAKACKACADMGVWMLNVHALGGRAMLEQASQAVASYPEMHLIAVTILTSLIDDNLPEIGLKDSVQANVIHLAKLAFQSGLDGVVCSGFEVEGIKKETRDQFLTITPGIRLEESQDDQRRVMTPKLAMQYGSDYLVIGRPITQSQDPELTLLKILETLK